MLTDIVLYFLVASFAKNFQENEYSLEENHFFLQLLLLQHSFWDIGELSLHDFLVVIVEIVGIRVESVVDFVCRFGLHVENFSIQFIFLYKLPELNQDYILLIFFQNFQHFFLHILVFASEQANPEQDDGIAVLSGSIQVILEQGAQKFGAVAIVQVVLGVFDIFAFSLVSDQPLLNVFLEYCRLLLNIGRQHLDHFHFEFYLYRLRILFVHLYESFNHVGFPNHLQTIFCFRHLAEPSKSFIHLLLRFFLCELVKNWVDFDKFNKLLPPRIYHHVLYFGIFESFIFDLESL